MNWKTFKKLEDLGYTPIEYLQSSESQHIDLGCKATQNTKVEIDFSPNTSTVQSLFGARTSSTSSDAFSIFTSATQPWPQYGSNQTQASSGESTVPGQKYNIIMGKDGAYLNGELIKTYATYTFTTPYNLLLFKKMQSSGSTDRPWSGKVYALKLWENGTLIRDLVPVSKNDVGYMYDLVNDVEYANAGTSSFTLGPRIKWTEFGKVFPFGNRIKSIKAFGEETYGLKAFGLDVKLLNYLCFVALESGTFKFSNNAVQYSLNDGSTWTTLAANTNTPTVSAGNKIMFKAELTPSQSSPYGIGTFSSTGQFSVQGNPMSLLYGDKFMGQIDLSGKNRAFYNLFLDCTKLVNAENLELPALTLSQYCYYRMFRGCTSLTTAPELPATTLATYCYYSMFNGCTSLTTAPELSAPTLVSLCCAYMFQNCSNLSYIKCTSTGVSSGHTSYWVQNVATNGIFVKDSSVITWASGDSGIPSGWTILNI